MNDNLKESDESMYWMDELENSIKSENLLCDYFSEEYEIKKYSIDFNEVIGGKLKDICKGDMFLIYSFLVALMKINLSRYMYKKYLTIGIPCYITKNTKRILQNRVLPLTSDIDYEKTCKDYMIYIKNKISEIYMKQGLLKKSVLVESGVCNDVMDLTPINICMKGFHEERHINYICNSSKNEILFSFQLSKDNLLKLDVIYNSKKFSKDTICSLCKTFEPILISGVNNYNNKIKDVHILSDHEKNKILYEFNDTKSEYPIDKTIHELFEDQVEKTPNNIAVEFENEQITYRELNEKSNSLAATLREKGVGTETIVSILVDRSIDMIVGIIAILKAGAAYLPIDPKQPKDRIKYTLEECEVKLLLTQTDFIRNIDYDVEIIDLQDKRVYTKEKENLKNISNPGNLAYIIYTSGSTGLPKGVMIEHKGVVRLVKNTNYISVNSKDAILQLSNYAFDGSVFDIYGALLNGAKLVLISKDNLLQIDKLGDVILDKKISIFFVTTALFNTIVDTNIEYLRDVRKVLFGGERISVKHAKKALEYLGTDHIVHIYGPTEGTVYTTYHFIDTIENDAKNIPIGKSISNSTAYVLGKNNELLPIGIPGELCVGGDGVARGYFKKTELTGEKFIDNPFKLDEKIYKTGDLVRWLPDGSIEFLGRIDNQVKIRGFRIELGEIENKLLMHKDIKEVAVTIAETEEKEKYICAYVVSENEISDLNLRGYLKETLPEYMIPTFIMQVEKIALTANGKFDKRSLPKPNLRVGQNDYEGPRNDLEKTLARIWSEALGIEKIGINDNFFELGGHSLKAMTLISKIHKETNKDIPLKELFNEPTIKGISTLIESAEESIYSKIERIEEKEYYEASSAQKRMYIIQGFDKESIAYNIPQIFQIEGSIDKNKIECIFKKLVERHEALRTYVETVGDEIVQKIDVDYEFNLEYRVELASIEEVVNDFIKPFNLGKAPLFRVEVVNVQGKNYLLIDMHHIISDGVSISILINEFSTIYNGSELEPLKIQYKDFAAWQNNFLNSKEMTKQEEYWTNMFNNDIPILNLPYDYERSAIQSFEGESGNIEVDSKIVTGLKQLTKKTGTTMHMVLLSAFTILLSKYSGQEDIVVGTPIAGRPHSDLQNIMGMFVNTLALRNRPEEEKRYIDFLNEVKENSLKAYDNQSYQLETLIEKLDIVRDASRNPLFDVMFNMLDTVSDIDIKLNDMSLIPYVSESTVAKFDLTLNAMEQNDTIAINIGYCSKLFKKSSIERLGRHYLAILENITINNEMKLGEIELLKDEEKNVLLNEFNDSSIEFDNKKTIQELFEEQVEKKLDNIAVVFGDKKLTYKELNEKSNKLARALRNKGVKADSVVGIIVNRSLEMIIGIIGILKAGGAYLPIDPSYPKKRIEYMLSDSESNVVLTTESLINDIEFNGEIIDLLQVSLLDSDDENLEKINNEDNLAYVIYTSGTTGSPKGVMLKHSNLNNFIMNFNRSFNSPIGSNDKVLSLTNYVFDVSVCEIFVALTNGATLVINDKHKTFDPLEISNLIVKNDITFTYIPPLLLTSVYEGLRRANREIKLNKLFVGVEPIRGKTLNNFYKINNDIEIINAYGPTETTIYSTVYKVNGDEIEDKVVPIGKPVGNTRIYILNSNKLQPIGMPGELHISGNGLARGYLNKPELTSEKFVDNPFEIGDKMYKTGDLARWLPDGNIEFLGRVDNQVKVRGFRIELGEIESKILQHEDVKEVVVIVIDYNDDKQICAYIVSDKEISKLNLKDYLKESLPEYMIPSYFVKLEKMPITSNGKLDRKALPKPNLDKILTSYEAPRNALEEILVKIWREVLGIDKIGINDDFFKLGGHSLKAMILISKIHKETNKELQLKKLFKSPTIKGISKFIENAEENIYSKIEKVEEKKYYEASSAQKRMYIIQGFDKENTSYNMPQIFKIQGSINRDKIENTFKRLVSRHEVLRTYFETVEDGIVQKIDNNYEFRLKEQTSYQDIEEIINDFIKSFDLGKAPLFRVEIVKTQGENYLLIDMHHIISDGVSMNILINEFAKIYNGGDLKPLKLQYKDFAEWQNNFLKSKEMKKQEEYWINMFNDEIPVLNLPYDYERPAIKSFEGNSMGFKVDKDLTYKLKELSKKTGTTMHMVLLSAFNILLSKYSGQKDIVIGTPIAGRPHADLQNIIGIFVNTLALRNKPESNKKYIDFLNEVKENSLKAYDNQSYQIEKLIEKLNIKRDSSRNPLFDVMFNMINMASDINLDDISLMPYDIENNVAKFDLTLNIMEQNDELIINIEYCSKLFNKNSIKRLGKYYLSILDSIIANNEIKLKEIELLSHEERDCLINHLNSTFSNYSKKTVYELFEDQVTKTPNKVAIEFNSEELTYKELNERANQLANQLMEKGIDKKSIVAIMETHSIELMVSILAVLKTGAAYLPIDPTYPIERINYMLEDSKSCILLTNLKIEKEIKFMGSIINIKDINLGIYSKENLEKTNDLDDLAYIIYTSGSTGKPKGVMIEHQGLTNYIWWANKMYLKDQNEAMALYSSISFDLTVTSIFTPLISGNKIDIYENDETEFVLYKILRENKSTVVKLTPAHLTLLKDRDNTKSSIKRFIIGGEDLKVNLAKEVYNSFGKSIEIYNEYGPTETVVGCMIYKYDEKKDQGVSVPIGHPSDNVQIYILDNELNTVPTGVIGEIYVSGDGVARGYINREDLTKEKFIENPFIEGKRMYKTGDTARYLENGSIEYIGRADNQIKLRGFRIELGEIEKKLLQHDDIKEATAIVIEDKENDKHICAYVVSRKEINELNLNEYLKENLPEYMVPSYFVKLEKMPITSNGKLDRKALPKPNLDKILTSYEAPRNALEEILVKIWREVLIVDKIGINDNFFKLGGNSLKVIKFISKINKKFNVEISIKDIYHRQTIKDLSCFIAQSKKVCTNINHDNVILLKNSSKNLIEKEENLFIIHDGSGDIGGYIELASNLKDNIKCWGIKANKKIIYKSKNLTIEELAEAYITIIKNIQPNGYYNIAGWSLGGVIAFEMVRQLEKSNDQIKNLLLIDSYINPKLIKYNKVLKEDLSLDTEKMNLISYINNYDFKQKISKQKLDKIKLKLPEEITSIIPNIEELDFDELASKINVIRRLTNALKLYKPKNKVKKQPILFKAKEESQLNLNKWNKYCEYKFIVKEVCGNHYTIVKGGNVDYIVDSFNKLI
ncbi:non-ribosomal peptide synthetase [Clostridium botulinum]|uniref:non-ribosomal peptide synthetase n=1 Tax=Clostridium botulinum TaxID=1491 RepID=UPI0019678AD5|nr:amino acid adenylation domain-containing protein [Clostridium botulinum]MBN1050274.1 amino acid adenylation domain-containing protein [Clostridium botulinum]